MLEKDAIDTACIHYSVLFGKAFLYIIMSIFIFFCSGLKIYACCNISIISNGKNALLLHLTSHSFSSKTPRKI